MLPSTSVSILKMLPPYSLICANVQAWPTLETSAHQVVGGELLKHGAPGPTPECQMQQDSHI